MVELRLINHQDHGKYLTNGEEDFYFCNDKLFQCLPNITNGPVTFYRKPTKGTIRVTIAPWPGTKLEDNELCFYYHGFHSAHSTREHIQALGLDIGSWYVRIPTKETADDSHN